MKDKQMITNIGTQFDLARKNAKKLLFGAKMKIFHLFNYFVLFYLNLVDHNIFDKKFIIFFFVCRFL